MKFNIAVFIVIICTSVFPKVFKNHHTIGEMVNYMADHESSCNVMFIDVKSYALFNYSEEYELLGTYMLQLPASHPMHDRSDYVNIPYRYNSSFNWKKSKKKRFYGGFSRFENDYNLMAIGYKFYLLENSDKYAKYFKFRVPKGEYDFGNYTHFKLTLKYIKENTSRRITKMGCVYRNIED